MKVTQKSINYMPKWSIQVKTVLNWPNWSKNRQILLYRSHLWLYRSHLLAALFEGLPEVQIRCRIAHWKGLEVYFPTQLELLNLELIWPSKIKSPKTAFCNSKRGQKVKIWLYFELLGAQISTKIWNPSIGKCIFAWKIQPYKVFPIPSCIDYRSRTGWDR